MILIIEYFYVIRIDVLISCSLYNSTSWFEKFLPNFSDVHCTWIYAPVKCHKDHRYLILHVCIHVF